MRRDVHTAGLQPPDASMGPRFEARPIVVAWHRLGPYHHARLRAAAARLPVVGLELSTVDSVNAWAALEGAEGFTKVTAFPGEDADRVPVRRLWVRLGGLLDELRPSAVAVHGWATRSALALMHLAIERRVPLVMMSESTTDDAARRWPVEVMKRQIVCKCAAALVGGRPQAAYLVALGMEPSRVFPGYDVVDNAHFAHGVATCRCMLELPRPFFLASARFVEKKNLLRLLEAFAYYRDDAGGAAWHLVILGDGPLRSALEALRARLGLGDYVLMPGFKQYAELPAWYGLASAFVHASTVEQWGLVVNEAMAAGLPVLVSDRCGCACDLVRDGVNGFAFDPYDIAGLAALMQRLAHGYVDREAMGRASRAIIADWGPECFAQALAAASETALRAPAPRVRSRDYILLPTMAAIQGLRGIQ
jgi:glycosyltransferase involved in cell wall biosynthesis